MRTRAPPVGCIAGTFAVLIVIVAAAIRAASAQAADTQVRIDSPNFAPHRLTADRTSGKALCSFARRGLKGWITLHRPDGEVDVRESVEEVMQAIESDVSIAKDGM
jgi:hypothetical protein